MSNGTHVTPLTWSSTTRTSYSWLHLLEAKLVGSVAVGMKAFASQSATMLTATNGWAVLPHGATTAAFVASSADKTLLATDPATGATYAWDSSVRHGPSIGAV